MTRKRRNLLSGNHKRCVFCIRRNRRAAWPGTRSLGRPETGKGHLQFAMWALIGGVTVACGLGLRRVQTGIENCVSY